MSRWSTPSAIHAVRSSATPLSNTETFGLDAVANPREVRPRRAGGQEGRPPDRRLEGVAVHLEGRGAQPLADPGAPAFAGEYGLAVLGVLARRRRGQARDHVGDGRRRHDDFVAAGRKFNGPRRPLEAAA